MSIAPTAASRRLPGFRLGAARGIWLYNLVLVATSAVLWAGLLGKVNAAPLARVGVPWWSLAFAFYLAEAYVVHVHFRREAHTISLSEVGLVIGLYVLSPVGLLLAQLVGAGAALALHRRQRPVKLVFNLAQFTLTTYAAVVVFHTVSRLGGRYGPAEWAAALGATVTASLLGIAFVTLAIRVAQREWSLRQVPATAAISVVATAATTALALALIDLVRIDPRSIVLLVVPGAIVAVGFRAMMEQRRRHQHLEFLYDSMQATQGAPEFGLAVGQLLIAARQLVRAEYAEIFLFPRGADQGLRSTLASNSEMLMQPAEISTADRLVLALAETGSKTQLLPRHRLEHPLDGYLSARNLTDGLLALLGDSNGPFGFLLVGDRSGDIDTFGPDDASLLETFAGHASVLIENGRLERSLAEVTELKDELRHQAFHDGLTGLPNRALFTEQVAAATAERFDGDGVSAVLFLDLDDFKAINDSMGHSIGDELLVEIAARIQLCLRPGDTPARLGGDEFAVLLAPTTSDGAATVAARILTSFSKPFKLSRHDTYVHASIGIALAAQGQSAEQLLLNADVAMYAAKTAGKSRYAHYQPALHARVRKRHELALALEHAVERGELTTVFQPIHSLRTGRVVSFETLARWRHPEHGLVMPDDFIPIAEQTGLMPEIGSEVLRQACRTAKIWQEAHPEQAEIGVSVNLSPTQLDDQLANEIARTLVEARLESRHLTLEITESNVMVDPDLALERLYELRALGARLALDDFGTGHSSLARLDTLPFNLLKIAKPFVDRLLDARPETSFVDAFVRLAYSLEMECVAEGIEHDVQVPRLLDRGCGLGQGYYFARPMSADKTLDYLDATRIASSGT